MKTASARVHGLDTLRSVAIVSVVVFHVLTYGGDGKISDSLVPAALRGWMGVDLFFVLSGYLIGSQLMRPYVAGTRPGLWAFYRKRFYRVLPAYWTVLALYFLASPGWREMPDLAPAWAFLTFTLNLVIGRYHGFAFSHAWSLCVEEHFYLVLPLLLLALMRRPSTRKAATLVAGFTLAGIALRASIWFYYSLRDDLHFLTQIYYPTYTHFDGLVMGVVIAAIATFRRTWWDRIARHGHWLTVGALAVIAVCGYLFTSTAPRGAVGAILGYPLLSIGLGLLVLSAMSNNGLLSRMRIPGAKPLAMISYSLYLTHKAMIHCVNAWFPALDAAGGWRWWAAYIPLSLGAACLLYLCVERPFLRLRDHVAAKRRTPAESRVS